MVSRRRVAPDRADVVWLDHDPRTGHEQSGRRPALVLSPKAYNRAAGLMLCCPVTTQAKGYPFEVELTGVKGLKGVVLSDQVRSLDWQARGGEKAGRATDDVMAEVLARLKALLGF